MQGQPHVRRSHLNFTVLAQPPPTAASLWVELLLVPTAAETHHGTDGRDVELLDGDPSPGLGGNRQPRVAGRRCRERRRNDIEEGTWTDRLIDPRLTVKTQRQTCGGRLEVAAADHQPASAAVAADPCVDRAVSETVSIDGGNTCSLRRQRPAFADEPLRLVNAIPIHLVRARAAQQHRIRDLPPESLRVAVLHEVDARAQRIDNEPDGRAPATGPVLHRFEPLVLWWRGQRLRDRRKRIAEPLMRAPEIEGFASIGRENRRRGAGWRLRPHCVSQPKCRRGRARIGRDRGTADMRGEHGQRDRAGEADVVGHGAQPGNGEIRDRYDQRQRVSAGERFLKQQIEDQIRTERDREQGERVPLAARQADDANRRERQSRRSQPATSAHGAAKA